MNEKNQTIAKAFAFHQSGNLGDAEALYRAVLASDPKNADVLQLLGVLQHQRDNHEEAIRLLELSLEIDPRQAEAWSNHGACLQAVERQTEALASYDKAIALKPDCAAAYYNRGNILQALDRQPEALTSYDKAIALKPDYAEAYNNRGNVLGKMKRYDDALASYDKAIALNPDYAEAYYNRGDTLRTWQRFDDALASYDKARALKPDSGGSYNNMGNVLMEMRRYEEALPNYEKAMLLKPDIPHVMGILLHAKMCMSDWQGVDALFDKVIKETEAGKPVSPPLQLVGMSSSAAQQKQCSELFVRDKYPEAMSAVWQGERYAHSKIRVAYVSADFREHPLSYLMAGLFERQDKTRFDYYAISLAPEEQSATGARVRAAFDHFIDVAKMDDREVAQLLRDLEIDIAVDLMGFTQNCRTAIFAYRPAPVQVNYLGFPATMGAGYMDYIIADAFVIPPERRADYSEHVVYLPDCFQANDDKRFLAKEKPARARYGLPEEGFVFCSFNNTYKITPVFFAIWMRLLKQVPGSVLWLLGGDTVEPNLRAEAAHRGVDPSRLVFAARMPYEAHLTRLPVADLFLDSLPFNAGTTASDALWAGLPLLTCTGEAFAARMAGSLLTAVGLPELITDNVHDYEALALELATRPERLAAIRTKLARNKSTHPLFDTDRFRRHIERAYITMVERYQKGLPPESFAMAAIQTDYEEKR